MVFFPWRGGLDLEWAGRPVVCGVSCLLAVVSIVSSTGGGVVRLFCVVGTTAAATTGNTAFSSCCTYIYTLINTKQCLPPAENILPDVVFVEKYNTVIYVYISEHIVYRYKITQKKRLGPHTHGSWPLSYASRLL